MTGGQSAFSITRTPHSSGTGTPAITGQAAGGNTNFTVGGAVNISGGAGAGAGGTIGSINFQVVMQVWCWSWCNYKLYGGVSMDGSLAVDGTYAKGTVTIGGNGNEFKIVESNDNITLKLIQDKDISIDINDGGTNNTVLK